MEGPLYPVVCSLSPGRFVQHFSSQVIAARLSGPACIWQRSAQALQVVNFVLMTSVQLPPLVSQRAYCRHRSPIRYSMVQTSGTFVPHARSEPWQVVNPQVAGAGVSAKTVTGTVAGTGEGVTFPPEVRVQPAVKSTDTSTTMHMPYIRGWFFIHDHVCCNIRRGVYLWVYFTAKILGAKGLLQDYRMVIPISSSNSIEPENGPRGCFIRSDYRREKSPCDTPLPCNWGVLQRRDNHL